MASLKTKIFQVYFKKEQETRLDSDFFPYDNSNSENRYYEFGPLLDIYENNKYKQSDYTGVFSYKFHQKTGISGSSFIRFVEDNPGYDLYIINPHCHLPYFYYNVWEQGEFWHAGLKKVAEKILKELQLCESLDEVGRHGADCASYANFWVGNERFWNYYGELLIKVSALVHEPEYEKLLFGSTYHANSEASYFPFFIERLLSTVVSQNKKIKVLSYQFSRNDVQEACFFEEEINILDKATKLKLTDINSYGEISKEHYELVRKLIIEKGVPSKIR